MTFARRASDRTELHDRLRRDDFNDPHEPAKFATTAHLSLQEFRDQFEYLVKDEPPPLDLTRHWA